MGFANFPDIFFTTGFGRSKRGPAARFRPKKTAPWHSSCKVGGVNQNKIYIMNQQRHTNEDTLTDIFGSEEMRSPAPTEFIPKGKTAPEIAYQLVKDETYPQTQPRLNLATFVTPTWTITPHG